MFHTSFKSSLVGYMYSHTIFGKIFFTHNHPLSLPLPLSLSLTHTHIHSTTYLSFCFLLVSEIIFSAAGNLYSDFPIKLNPY